MRTQNNQPEMAMCGPKRWILCVLLLIRTSQSGSQSDLQQNMSKAVSMLCRRVSSKGSLHKTRLTTQSHRLRHLSAWCSRRVCLVSQPSFPYLQDRRRNRIWTQRQKELLLRTAVPSASVTCLEKKIILPSRPSPSQKSG